MSQAITWVGLDVHKKTIAVAVLRGEDRAAVEWTEVHEPAGVKRLIRALQRESQGVVRCCYEAGPTGYGLQRHLRSAGFSCQVIAPSLTPVQPGKRIKTDRRDARKLAELLRANLLTEVTPPTDAEEALRDLCRAREDAQHDLLRARHRLSKFLLRRTVQYADGRAWGSRHHAWLQTLRFEEPAAQATFDTYFLAVQQLVARLHDLDAAMEARGAEEPYREPVAHLRCLRGIDTVTAVSLVAELFQAARFTQPRQLMAYLGLVPRECSSGERERRGAITKTGNSHVRRLLVEAAWHNRHRPGVSRELRLRRAGQPAWVLALADKAHHRLYRRYQRLTARGLVTPKVVVAVARELVGFVWAVLRGPAAAQA